MDALAEILEQELESAVEVKDKKSLHRYVLLLSQNLVSADKHKEETYALHEDIREITETIKIMQSQMIERFEAVDTRFEAVQKQMDERFTGLQKQMDERFTAVDRRFEVVQKQMDERFTGLQKQMDERFTASQSETNERFAGVNSRFKMMFTFMTIGFSLLAVLMTTYNFI